MTLNLKLPPELEERLTEEAERAGMRAEQYTLRLLDANLPRKDRRRRVVDLLQSWIDASDVEEQIETGEYLVHALDEDRLSDRKLFPPELQGVTW